MIPDTDILQRDRINPTMVRVTALERVWILGFRLPAKAQRLAQEMFERSAGTVGAWPVSQPTVVGGVVVLDYRISKTQTALAFRRRLADEFDLRIEDVELDRITRSDLSRSTAPASRTELAEEAEEEAAATRLTFQGIGGGIGRTIRGVQIVLLLGVLGAGLIVVPRLVRDLKKATGN